jgi:hypothetical protein
MRPSRLETFYCSLPPIFLAVSLFVLYCFTLAPDITWANGGGDGGDLISAAATGGVPHPTGYPLYLLLARIFQTLPFGTLSFRTNLLSAVASVLAAVLVYGLVLRTQEATRKNHLWPAGMLAGYAFGLAPLVWSQGVITEVYALQACLTAMLLYLYVIPANGLSKKRRGFFCGLMLGLALANHITAILLVPAALLVGSVYWRKETSTLESKRRWRQPVRLHFGALGRQALGLGLGLCLYLILPLRALAQPPVNWGNPVSLERFWWLVSGQLYRGYYLPGGLAGLGERLQAWAALMLEQFGLPGLALGLAGLALFARASRLTLLSIWTALIYSVFAVYYSSVDSYVYLIPVLLVFSIWIGVGASGFARALSQRSTRLGLVVIVILGAYFAARAGTNFRQVDASQDLRAVHFAEQVFSTVPEDALIFVKGDRALFTLWYYHLALEERPDLVVLATDLLHFDWYLETLQEFYPSLAFPASLPYPESLMNANPARAACYIEYTDQTEIECLDPLSSQ